MSNCDCHRDCQENLNYNEATVAATAAKKPVGDGLLITMLATAVGIFFSLRAIGAA